MELNSMVAIELQLILKNFTIPTLNAIIPNIIKADTVRIGIANALELIIVINYLIINIIIII